jgi:putative transposase
MYGRKVKLRFLFIILILTTLILTTFLVLKSLEENVVYFQSPSEIKSLSEIDKSKIRVGGMVKKNSISISSNEVNFIITDFKNEKGLVKIDKVNEVWSSDITYIKLEKGFAYLCAIIDWHTKKILSWKISNTMDVYLTTSVLKDALNKYPKPKIFNSDQGSQYTAKEHIEILKNHNISISMDARDRSIDNIVIERFWRTIKYENIYPTSYNTIKEARDGINQYINFYNTKRIHSSIEYKCTKWVILTLRSFSKT